MCKGFSKRYLGRCSDAEFTDHKKRNNNINQIQTFAAILVIFSHAFPLSGRNSRELLLNITHGGLSFGNFSVAVLFVMSGFLVTASYQRNDRLVPYLWNRIIRLFPELLVVLVLSSLFLGPIFTTLPLKSYLHNPLTWRYLKNMFLNPMQWDLPGVFSKNSFGTSVNGALWTLPFQFSFIVLGLLGFLGILRHRKIILFLWISLIIAEMHESSIVMAYTHIGGLPMESWIQLSLYFTSEVVFSIYANRIPFHKTWAMICIVLSLIFFCLGDYVLMMALPGTYLIFLCGIFRPYVAEFLYQQVVL